MREDEVEGWFGKSAETVGQLTRFLFPYISFNIWNNGKQNGPLAGLGTLQKKVEKNTEYNEFSLVKVFFICCLEACTSDNKV